MLVCGADDQDVLVHAIPGIPAETQELTQTGATWGLDRIDSRTGLNGDYNFDQTGAGVTVFVLDDGVLPSHPEFTGRYLGCRDFSGEGCGAAAGTPGDHGTHVGKLICLKLKKNDPHLT